jgi:hypothetical protein
MKSLVLNIRDYFNRRTKVVDTYKEADVNRKALVIENGESAKRLLRNDDFALLFNLYRFYLLEMLEESKDDVNRIDNAQRVAGVRDFIEFIERTEYLAKVANKNVETLTK